jgi:preprotein translocase subunit SecD
VTLAGLAIALAGCASALEINGANAPTPTRTSSPSTSDRTDSARTSQATSASNRARQRALTLRGLVAPAVPLRAAPTGATASVANPGIGHRPNLSLGSAAVPLSESQYDTLSPTLKRELAAQLASYRCADTATEPNDPASYYVACATDRSYVYLLGPAIVTGADVDSAAAIAPSVNEPQWTVALNFTTAGSNVWADYTIAHNLGTADDSKADPATCVSSAIACADFVGIVHDATVISIPVTLTEIRGATQISGDFTQASAIGMAHKLNGQDASETG